ncbi:hypothetical protein [Halopseudomonas aestusnigri]|uniref:hypothetical protein n=1 Tax=Halopseudomonas aestusnigri TaxID=857252 RepID=UPI0028BFEE35|nr:hypothetical protein YSKK_28470 [Halopseudomonas aestusnigri]
MTMPDFSTQTLITFGIIAKGSTAKALEDSLTLLTPCLCPAELRPSLLKIGRQAKTELRAARRRCHSIVINETACVAKKPETVAHHFRRHRQTISYVSDDDSSPTPIKCEHKGSKQESLVNAQLWIN